MKKITLLTLVMLLAMPALAGTKSVDESVKADSNADVSIELIAGTVRVIGWNKNEVRVQGTLNDKWETLEIDGDGNDISIEISLPDGNNRNVDLDADLEISVPAGVELTFEAVSAPLTVEGLTNALSVESISGSIRVAAGLEEIEIESISGRVEIEGDSTLDSVDVESVSGSIEYTGDLISGGDYSFTIVSGRITLNVPSGASADYSIETFSGSIDNEFGPKPEKGEWLPSEELTFSVGSGSADVTIEAVSGTIRLKAN